MRKISRVLLIALGSITGSLTTAEPPTFSVGSLDVDPTWNREDFGSKPLLSWTIDHRRSVEEFCQIDPQTGAIWSLTELRVRVHVIGLGRETSPPPHLVSFHADFSDGAGWRAFFEGTPLAVKAHRPVVDRIVPENKKIQFAAMGISRSEGSYFWLELRSNENAAGFVRAFRQGEAVPSVVSWSPEVHLRAYLSEPAEGTGVRTFKIGPRDVLLLFELNATSTTDPRFDLQDLAVLVTLERT